MPCADEISHVSLMYDSGMLYTFRSHFSEDSREIDYPSFSMTFPKKKILTQMTCRAKRDSITRQNIPRTRALQTRKGSIDEEKGHARHECSIKKASNIHLRINSTSIRAKQLQVLQRHWNNSNIMLFTPAPYSGFISLVKSDDCRLCSEFIFEHSKPALDARNEEC